MRNVSDKLCARNESTFHVQLLFSFENLVWDNVEKCGGSRLATDGDTAHALCMLAI
jgi:hypothetical protein